MSDYKNTPEYQKGWATLKSKHPPETLQMLEEMYRVSPALADVIIAHGISDIWEKKTPHLSMQEKEIASLAVLIEQQNLLEIKIHAHTCLKLGISKERIFELLTFLSLYSGVPKIVLAYKSVQEAIKEYDLQEKERR